MFSPGASRAWPCALLVVLLAAGGWAAVPVAPAADAKEALAAVLGDDPAAWKSSGGSPVAETLNGRDPALAAAKALTLESAAVFDAPLECRVRVNLQPAGKAAAAISCSVACADLPGAGKRALTFSLSATAGDPVLRYTRAQQGLNDDKNRGGTLALDAVGERSLAWPETMRRVIEAQAARTPAAGDLYQAIRIQLRKGQALIWLNGRLVDRLALAPELALAGTVRLQLTPNAHLLGVEVGPPDPIDPRFEPVYLSAGLNAAGDPAGQPFVGLQAPGATRPALPGQKLVLGDVPFFLPARGLDGSDHVDLGASWMRFGSLAGYFTAHRGLFGGRWTGMDRLDPARLVFSVPPGQYRALHLIAAADGAPDSVPTVTAQFFRPAAGHPVNFAGSAPRYNSKAAGAVSVQLERGKAGALYHVAIPLDPDSFAGFTDLPRLGLELTKAVLPYRAYPDPLEYSWHAAGLPSGVHVYAATLERAKVDVDIRPTAPHYVWTAPAKPGCAVVLRNATGKPLVARLVLSVLQNGEPDGDADIRTVSLPGGDEPVTVDFTLDLARYGLHELRLAVGVGSDNWTCTRSLAYLHEDTRERGDWAEGKGPIFGFWPWDGGHDTPPLADELAVMAAAGAESCTRPFVRGKTPDEIYDLAARLKMHSAAAFEHRSIYSTLFFDKAMAAKYDPARPEETAQALIEDLKKIQVPAGELTTPQYIAFFPEPQIGRITSAIPPAWYGEPDYAFTETDADSFQRQLTKFLIGAKAVRKEWPDAKILLPYGDPMNTVVYLQKSPETRALIDGCALDIPCFERLPEAQIHQCVVNRLYVTLAEIKKYVKNPYLVMVEGPAVSSKDVDTGEREQANLAIRNFLVLMTYGVMNHESANAPFDCAGYWGENHYGGGWMSRRPLAMPKPAYVAYAAMTRHLNRANFSKGIATGSTAVHCLQFRHYRTGKLVHVLWTIRGRRPVTVRVGPGEAPVVYDADDNATVLPVRDGAATFTIDDTPRYLEGLTADARLAPGEPDHGDAAPAPGAVKLANLAGGWKLSDKGDETYAANHPLQIARFPGVMTAATAAVPDRYGKKALAVHLGPQPKDRGVMPFYAVLEPKAPVAIPGKGGRLGLWVKAAGDWGRVVYSLRDAKGERWISIGAREQWNSDDIHCWSYFNFDGWRYLSFPLPASAPYDSYREIGATWWGSYGGDGIVDLPLKLEKIIVERREKVIYNAELVPAKPDDVLLGDLCVEYAVPEDRSDRAVALSRLRMPAPPGEPVLENPIAELAKTGAGEPAAVLKVTDPLHQYDGTRCNVHFAPVAGAQAYDVWVGPYPDGRGALLLGKGWKESGGLVQGLRPDTPFYAFVVYTDRDGKPSKPSRPYPFTLKDLFGYK